MKYPIGIQDFASLRKDGYTYVDKTALVFKLADEGKYYFLSRPRRFGKSLLLSTMEAYFRGKRELFQGLALETLETEWAEYPVLHLDLNKGKYDASGSLDAVLGDFLSKLEATYGASPSETTLALRFNGVIERAAAQTGRRVVILVDEYDKPMLQAIGDETLQAEFRSTLKAFYGALKSQDRNIRFAFLTGVTKFGKVSVFSDLNNLQDISMDEDYQDICGITEAEMHRYFEEGIRALGERSHLTYEATCQRLERMYDGYHFTEESTGVYNPFSLLNTLSRRKFGSYWFETGTPTFLAELLRRDHFRLPDMTRQQVSADFLNSIDTMDRNPLPVIYQSGYLTIKGYDPEFRTYTLGYPNEEVEEGFTKFLLPWYTSANRGDEPMYIENFVRSLRGGRPDDFMQRMAALFAATDYKIVGDAELYFQNAFYLVTELLGFYVEVERAISDGRLDMVVKTQDYIYIFEFKLDKSPEAALRQIEEKGYAAPFAADPRRLFKVGVNFSREKRRIDGWQIE